MRSLVTMVASVALLGAATHGYDAGSIAATHEKSAAVLPAKATTRHPGSARLAPQSDPHELIDSEALLTTLEDLTSIRSHSGWRHSTSMGEERAIAYVEDRLATLGFLRSVGLEVERQYFRTYLGIEFWETRVHIDMGSGEIEVPADAPAGHRDSIALARRFDSDGILNDSRRDPVVVSGPPLIVRSAAEIGSLTAAQVAGHVVFVDYAAIDRVINDPNDAIDTAWTLAELQPVGIVMVTEYSNRRGQSHGSFAGDLPAFTWVEVDPLPPVLSVRLEDMAVAGIDGWDDLEGTESVRLTWDVDLFSPGHSSLLMARIPGLDSSQSIILGAHIDSPNSPGALDNGSGSTALLEVATALDHSRTKPPLDLYLVWFGSHERGLFGSSNFVTTHSELLDQSLAMLQMDCLGRPMNGLTNFITLEAWPYGRFGSTAMPWLDHLEEAAADHGIDTEPVAYYGLSSDNSSFNGFDVPNANLIYMNPYDILEIHYDNHLHDPYDTIDRANEVSAAFEEMARVMLVAALETDLADEPLRVTPPPTRRALFVGSHTESPHMSPASFSEFGMALAWEGFDVDMIPYGQTLTAADLDSTDLLIVLPVHDYPSPEGDVSLYDEAWNPAEIDAIESWVRDGGLMVLTNSAHRLKYMNYVYDVNEDAEDMNALAERFGVRFLGGSMPSSTAYVTGSHPLVTGIDTLRLAAGNTVPHTADSGQILASTGAGPVVQILDADAGEVLVLGDLGLLGSGEAEPTNLQFWKNLAAYARAR